jgi:hypothetical protein
MPYIVSETNHGIDGRDATHREIATFDSIEGALDALEKNGYCVDWNGIPILRENALNTHIYHQDKSKRWTMGCISYSIKPWNLLPHNTLNASSRNCVICGLPSGTQVIHRDTCLSKFYDENREAFEKAFGQNENRNHAN